MLPVISTNVPLCPLMHLFSVGGIGSFIATSEPSLYEQLCTEPPAGLGDKGVDPCNDVAHQSGLWATRGVMLKSQSSSTTATGSPLSLWAVCWWVGVQKLLKCTQNIYSCNKLRRLWTEILFFRFSDIHFFFHCDFLHTSDFFLVLLHHVDRLFGLAWQTRDTALECS